MAYTKTITYRWNDDTTETTYNALVSVDEEWNSLEDEEDDGIFFYFASADELERAKTGEGYEFTVLEVED
jgi:hypothetical protein